MFCLSAGIINSASDLFTERCSFLLQGCFSGTWCMCSVVFHTSRFPGRIPWLMICSAVLHLWSKVFGVSVNDTEFCVDRPRSDTSMKQCASITVIPLSTGLQRCSSKFIKACNK